MNTTQARKSAATSERRESNRQNIVQSATIYAENAPVMSPGFLVQVSNISGNGICFDSTQPSDEGSICRIMISGEALKLNSRARITRCEKRDNQFVIGAEFIEELPEWTPADN